MKRSGAAGRSYEFWCTHVQDVSTQSDASAPLHCCRNAAVIKAEHMRGSEDQRRPGEWLQWHKRHLCGQQASPGALQHLALDMSSDLQHLQELPSAARTAMNACTCQVPAVCIGSPSAVHLLISYSALPTAVPCMRRCIIHACTLRAQRGTPDGCDWCCQTACRSSVTSGGPQRRT